MNPPTRSQPTASTAVSQRGAGWRCIALCGLLALSGCGGSGEQTGATDLYGAYDVITQGMSEAQTTAIIGAEPSGRQADGAQGQTLTWEADRNTYRHISLMVTFHPSRGATRKIITGYRGNKSQTF